MCTLIRNLGLICTFFFNCLVGCLSMIVWTPAVLVSYIHVSCCIYN